MANVNKVILAGNMTRAVEIKYTTNNTAVGQFGLAINRKFGEKEETTFVDCTVWGKQAEVMAQYTDKGSSVFIEGRLTLDQWEDKNGGGKRSKLFVTVENFQFLDRKGESKAKSTDPQSRRQDAEDEFGDQDDIPF